MFQLMNIILWWMKRKGQKFGPLLAP
jgi:hypothetical protein